MLETNKIYNDDNINILKQLDSNSIDMVLTSPPYDDLRVYKNTLTWNFDIFKQVANELARIIKDGGVIVWIVSDGTEDISETGTSFKQALYFKEIGLKLYDTMIWRKPNPAVPTTDRYYNAFEYMFVISKGKPKTMNFICDKVNESVGNTYTKDTRISSENRRRTDKTRTVSQYSRRHNVWDIPIGDNPTKHPATFPLRLAVDHIKTWTNQGDIVLDPFMGSGTTCSACKDNNRRYIGIELVKEYYDMADNRLKNTSGSHLFY